MPEDIGDLRDVVDAINKLCDSMKTGLEERFEDCAQTVDPDPLPTGAIDEGEVATEVEPDQDRCVASREESDPEEVIFKKVEHYNTETWRRSVSRLELASSEDAKAEATERWSDSSVSLPPEVSELAQVNEISEMYYTASSEVSLSDLEGADRGEEAPAGERRECAAAGHVAAMRERFESLTRATTPAPAPERAGQPEQEQQWFNDN